MICREFFKSLKEAENWAPTQQPRVIGIYGLDKPGTIRRFEIERGDAANFTDSEYLDKMRAVVLYNR